MTTQHVPEQLALLLEPSAIDDLTPEQRLRTTEALAVLLLAALGVPSGETPNEN